MAAGSNKPEHRVFTVAGVDETKIHSPPVPGCHCTYCDHMRLYGFAIRGHGSQASHRLAGGDEHHNPENKGRLALRSMVSNDKFEEYVSKPGGHFMWFQGPSGLWYTTGRNMDRAQAGHFVYCYLTKTDPLHPAAALCLPPVEQTIPLVDIVIMHYLFLTSQEDKAWGTAALTVIDHGSAGKMPRPFRDRLGL